MAQVEKEKLIAGVERQTVTDLPPLEVSPRKAEKNLEVESLMTKIERRFARIPKGKPGVQDDQVVVQQAASQQPPVKLPLSQVTIKKGKKAPVELSVAWLVSWALRQIKMLTRIGRRVELADIPEVTPEPKKEGLSIVKSENG